MAPTSPRRKPPWRDRAGWGSARCTGPIRRGDDSGLLTRCDSPFVTESSGSGRRLALDAGSGRRYSEGVMQDWLKAQLAELAGAELLRDPDDSHLHERPSPVESGWLDACSNDYLGLGSRTVSRETLGGLEGARLGAGASRLVQGS